MKNGYLLWSLVAVLWFAGCCQECKDEITQAYETKIKALDKQIGELETRAASLGAEAKVKCLEVIGKLKVMKETAREKLAALKAAGSEAWQDLKPALGKAMDELEKGFDQAKSQFD